jgi:biopolymer transport protein ExbD
VKLMPARKKRTPLGLQLTAMIDIFSLIVIFLIKGTVFGEADISVPATMKLPKSISKETVETAARVTITHDSVYISALAKDYPMELFRSTSSESPALGELKSQLVSYVAKLPKEVRGSGVLLNVIADTHAPYRDIFDTISVLRQCGFETLLFIAMEESKG